LSTFIHITKLPEKKCTKLNMTSMQIAYDAGKQG